MYSPRNYAMGIEMESDENRVNGQKNLKIADHINKLREKLNQSNNQTQSNSENKLNYQKIKLENAKLNYEEIENQRKLIKLNKIKLINQLNKSKIPEKYRSATWEKYTADDNDELKNINILRNFAENFKIARGNGAGLILIGKVGAGKTLGSFCVFKTVCDLGFTANYTTAKRMIADLWKPYNPKNIGSMTPEKIRETYTSPDLLIIDELGKEGKKDTVRDALFDVLDERSSNNRPTIFIGNLEAHEIIFHLGEAGYSRALNGGMLLYFNGRDRRLTRSINS